MSLRAFLRPVAYAVMGRDPHPDSFLDRVTGVIHVGANSGQERKLYAAKNLEVVWIEPIPHVFDQLLANLAGYPRQKAIRAILHEKDGIPLVLNIASNEGASSSIMEFKEHKLLWPDVDYVDTLEMMSKTLVTLVGEQKIDLQVYNSLVLDTQGSELMILRGATPLLSRFAYVKTEVPDFEAYSGCPLLDDFNAFMSAQGFKLVSRRAIPHSTKARAYYDVTYKNMVLNP